MAHIAEREELPDSKYLVLRPEHLQVQLPLKVYVGGIMAVAIIVFSVATGWYSVRRDIDNLSKTQAAHMEFISRLQNALEEIVKTNSQLASDISRIQGRMENK